MLVTVSNFKEFHSNGCCRYLLFHCECCECCEDSWLCYLGCLYYYIYESRTFCKANRCIAPVAHSWKKATLVKTSCNYGLKLLGSLGPPELLTKCRCQRNPESNAMHLSQSSLWQKDMLHCGAMDIALAWNAKCKLSRISENVQVTEHVSKIAQNTLTDMEICVFSYSFLLWISFSARNNIIDISTL